MINNGLKRKLWVLTSPLLVCAWLCADNHCVLGTMVRGIPEVCAERSCCQKEKESPDSSREPAPTKSGQCCLDTATLAQTRAQTANTRGYSSHEFLSSVVSEPQHTSHPALPAERASFVAVSAFFATEFFKLCLLLANAPPSSV